MKELLKRTLMFSVALVVISMLTGCTNWEKKYKGLDVENQNIKGLYERCNENLNAAASDKSQLNQQLTKSIRTIEQLQKEIEDRNVSPGEASGFGSNMDVKFDAVAGTITVTLDNTLLFSSGKATLKKSTISELDHIRSVIKQRYASMPIDIVGHTDTDPIKKSSWKDNWELSAQRALSVLRYLESKGMSSDMLRAVAAGSSHSVASNASQSGKARNRRVEIVVRTKG
jgi:chemotaxis protein MotB